MTRLLYLRGSNDQGQLFAVDDPQAMQLQAIPQAASALTNAHRRAEHFAQHIPMLQVLADRPEFTGPLAGALSVLRHFGAAKALQHSPDRPRST